MDTVGIFIESIHSQKAYTYIFVVIACIVLAYISFFITRRYLVKYVSLFAKKKLPFWDEEFEKIGFLNRLSYLVPVVVINYFLQFFPDQVTFQLTKLLLFVTLVLAIFIVNTFLDVLLHIYNNLSIAKLHPIKGYIQVAKILVVIVCLITAVSFLVGVSPVGILTGMGALSAVLLLIFKDTILSFVASLQINAHDIFKVGDWIEIKSLGVDGDVIDISLHTVKVRNWDRTIVSVPTHKLLEVGVKNWRGMRDSGGRRIKRHLNIDFNSIRFFTVDELKALQRIKLLKDYFLSKKEIIEKQSPDDIDSINNRQLTNIGTFRIYIREYLKSLDTVHKEGFSFMVRQLQPTETGLPIEIYCFTTDVRWPIYEEIQADIFDHLIAVSSKFHLRIFQNISGTLK
ncbi:mechanosensitive ion channel domain-containing protein [Helicobacter sp. 11S02629-2]|uniref:mechanosensitive ion channel family protein n=1 Tax=Helicobacter sp. 11S02629-2 TaxID=1476195 RepID=UPI000BA6AF33|nr:mechanosensitive ion channel domain-containing protein [Helicobacter sp. 11S02629-2]PAF45949.1 hypothetical protein BKH40_00625 [Helicobacter sp. 11S02629-2]